MGGVHNLRSPTPELGLWIKEDQHHQGYGRELLQAIARWAGERYRPHYFIYPVAEQNLPSRRLAESLGGQLNGRRENIKYDCLVYHIPPVQRIMRCPAARHRVIFLCRGGVEYANHTYRHG
ncbi:Uncharacterised protein [Serratia rubidaea]|uniref:N-acetyltransferase domain-containing protein n=1 Tax=Serratia rubidaea TaxID=61652 RepID=A0A4U9HGF9_SERRU|nr:Uncharacterised protein [Serratia rubidaea]